MERGFTQVSGRAARMLAILFSLLAMSLLTGCAFSRTPVQVNFYPTISQPLKTPGKAALAVGEIKDKRLVGDDMVLLHKSNEYGPTSGAFVTYGPVATIFSEGLKRALAQNGFVGTNSVQYELGGQLQSFGFKAIQNGVIAAPTAKAWLEVRFVLVDKAKGLPVWHDTFTGQATSKLSFWTGGDGDDLGAAFSEAAKDAVQQLIADPEFRNYFE